MENMILNIFFKHFSFSPLFFYTKDPRHAAPSSYGEYVICNKRKNNMHHASQAISARAASNSTSQCKTCKHEETQNETLRT